MVLRKNEVYHRIKIMFYFWILILFFVNQFSISSTFPLNNSSEIINVNETVFEINLSNVTENSLFTDNIIINDTFNDNISDPIIQEKNFTENTILTTTLPLPSDDNITTKIFDPTILQHYLPENITNFTTIPSTTKGSSNNSLSILSIKCLPNQELKSCGSACPPTCGILEPKCKSNCIKDICQCKKGFVVHQNGTCIHPDNCPKGSTVKQCPPNSHLSPCGTLCPPTCTLPNPTICSLQCIVDDCVCDIGFVLENENHECIKLEECPKMKKICDQNETFHECGTKCEGTCNEPFPAFCSDECLKNVCQCSEGFVRNDVGKCILLSKCLL